MADVPVKRDLYARLRQLTAARIGLGRAGQALPTAPLLDFQLAHARACDAVHAELDAAAMCAAVAATGSSAIVVRSAACDRNAYLRNPDLGRRLAADSPPLPHVECDVAFVVGDGLSATAVHSHAAVLLTEMLSRLRHWSIAPVIVAVQARVALGDHIGELLGARSVVMLIGERPGLSAPDSLGAYLTWAPVRGRRDSDRNCVSNIRTPGGLSAARAADRIVWLLHEARRLQLSGVKLKDRSGVAQLPGLDVPQP